MKLIKNNSQFLLLSEEEPKVGDWVLEHQKYDLIGEIHFINSEYVITKEIQKVILAAHPLIKGVVELSLENIEQKLREKEERRIEELCKEEVGYFDYNDIGDLNKCISGYKLAKEENADKKYTEEGIYKVYQLGIIDATNGKGETYTEQGLIKSLEKPVEWSVEIEMEEMMLGSVHIMDKLKITENTIIINKIL